MWVVTQFSFSLKNMKIKWLPNSPLYKNFIFVFGQTFRRKGWSPDSPLLKIIWKASNCPKIMFPNEHENWVVTWFSFTKQNFKCFCVFCVGHLKESSGHPILLFLKEHEIQVALYKMKFKFCFLFFPLPKRTWKLGGYLIFFSLKNHDNRGATRFSSS